MERLFDELSSRAAVWLLPLATALHIFEEWPGFPRWARTFASPAYSDRKYLVTHAITFAGSVGFAALISAYPRPWVTFAFLLFWVGPGVFSNAVFHLGASFHSGAYCPGAITGLLLYLPLATALFALAIRDRLLAVPALVVVAVLAPALHALEVGHNVFKRW